MQSQADYFPLCDDIYRQFCRDSLRLPPELERYFKLNYAPEPYLRFPTETASNRGRPLLYFLTTNPGLPLRRQMRGSRLIQGGNYEVVQQNLGSNYLATFHMRRELRPALNRIKRMRAIADNAGFGGAMQVETLPWHSSALPILTCSP